MINVSVELDWDAARKHVEDHKLTAVREHQESLQRYIDERGMDEVNNYLATDYFDACGYRHWNLEEDAKGYDREGAIEAMKRIMVAYVAQKNIFGPLVAEEAFEDWRNGNHDT